MTKEDKMPKKDKAPFMTRKTEATKAPETLQESKYEEKANEKKTDEELLTEKKTSVKKPKKASKEAVKEEPAPKTEKKPRRAAKKSKPEVIEETKEEKQAEQPAAEPVKEKTEEKFHDEEAYSKIQAMQQEEKRYEHEANKKIINANLFGVVSSDIVYQIEQDQKEEDELYERLEQYRNDGTILWGTVSGIELNTEGNKVLVTVMWETTRILIPENVFFEKNWNFGEGYFSLPQEEKLARHIVAARSMLNANIPFVIKGVLKKTISDGQYEGEEEIIAVGDKTEAMEKLRDIYFYHRITESPIDVSVNDQANANIIYVAEEFITVECLGVETRIDAFNLNEVVVDNCRDYVKVGQVMRVRIKKIAYHEGEVYLAVTGRLNKGSKKISSIKVDGSYLGIVTQYNRSKGVYTCKIYPDVKLRNGKIVARDDGVNVSVKESAVSMHRELNIGDTVHIKVKAIHGDFAVGLATKV